MASWLEKSPKESLWGNSVKITEIKFAPSRCDVFMVFIVISHLEYYLYQNHFKALIKTNLLVLKLQHVLMSYQLLDVKAYERYENLNVLRKHLSCLELPDLHGQRLYGLYTIVITLVRHWVSLVTWYFHILNI